MKILFLILYFLAALAHLYGCLPRKNHSIAKYTKPLLIPLLLMAYGLSIAEPSLLLILALVFSCIGNCLLLHPENGMFLKIGYSAHGLSLLSYALVFLGGLGIRPVFWVLALAVLGCAALLSVILYKITTDCPRDMGPFVCIMATCGAFMGLSALLFAFTNSAFAGKLVFLGSILLMLSGVLHLSYRFHKRFRFGMVAITALFLAGQSLVILSLMGMGGI